MRRIKQFILLTNKDKIEQPVNTYEQYSDISFVICGINMGYEIKISYNDMMSIKKFDIIRYDKRYRIHSNFFSTDRVYIYYKYIKYQLTDKDIKDLYPLIRLTQYDLRTMKA